ncbi:hypothetical protein GF402_04770 [Candidatus Fermentibacteria bacterium]|nr:hypothetical protein [Candidatus Fermentibacteria bacterium]
MKKVFPFLLLQALVVVYTSAIAGIGVSPPSLLPDYPYRFLDREFPRIYGDVGYRVLVVPSVRKELLNFRLSYMGRPVSRARSWGVDPLLSRLTTEGMLRVWRRTNREHSIRRDREEGTLVPTIYLPLDMPTALERTIGEGGQLDISGHQKLTLSGITHYRPNAVLEEDESRSLFPDLKMEQELRIRLQGTIGEKIHVDVDHDSERSLQPESSISLRYEGWDDEIIQSVEMGDVSLSITGPEFVSYSIPHQGLFGAKVEAQVGPVDVTTIASKEASSTESAEFVGQATLYSDSLLDIHPARNYFFLTEPDTAPQPRIVSIRVFQDDLDGTNNLETGAVEGDWFLSDTTGSGHWDELTQGLDNDFVLEDSTYIRFISPISEYYRVAVWYVTAEGDTMGLVPSGGPYELKLIKDSNRTTSNPTWFYELRSRYFLGANNIVRESFECEIYLDRPGEDPVSTQGDSTFVQLLGLDTNGDGSMVDEADAVDWDNGFLVFPKPRPFDSEVLDVRNPQVYEKRNPQTSDSKYFISVSYRAASTTYTLGRLGIVPGSERVTLSSPTETITLQRDVDYTIIYEAGMLTLMGEAAEKAQDPTYELRVTFEYLPFMAAQQKLLFGTRAVYNLGQHSWVGTTMMFEDASTPDQRPRVGEESSRTFVTDVDAHLEVRPGILNDIANAVPMVNTDAESRLVLSGEVAASIPNPNVDGKAYIDDMEGAESSLPLGQSRLSWSRSSFPESSSPMLHPPGRLKWYNPSKRWKRGDIVPNLSEEDADDWAQTVLELCFRPADDNPTSWGGIMRCIDRYGMDMTRKTRIRLYVRPPQNTQDATLYIDIGERINEDAVWLERVGGTLRRWANGELDTEDVDGDGIFEQSSEDTGLDNVFSSGEEGYDPDTLPDPNKDDQGQTTYPYERINGTEGNKRLDTEDLNGNGALDASNSFFRIEVPLYDDDYVVSENLQTGWKLIEVPLDDSLMVTVPENVSGQPTWEKVSYVRLWTEGYTTQDTLLVYDMSVVGNRWEQRNVTVIRVPAPPVKPYEQLLVSTVNNKENPEYINDPPPGVDPGEDERGDPKLEQSIRLNCVSMEPGHEGRAKQVYYSSESYTGYGSVQFLLHGSEDAPGEFFYRLGSDSLNYYEINVPLRRGWQVVRVSMEDLVALKQQLQGQGGDFIRSDDLAIRGTPNFADVVEMSIGIRNTSSSTLSTEVWVNDITLHDPRSEADLARRMTAEVDFADLLLLDGDYRCVGADFHGLGEQSGQGYESTRYTTGGTLNMERFTPPLWSLSAPFGLAWTRKTTEPVFQPSSDVRLSDEESWANRTDVRTFDTSLQLDRNARSDNVWLRYFVDPLRFAHNYGRSNRLAPNSRDSSTSHRIRLSYSLSPGPMRLLELPVLKELRLRPTSVGWSAERSAGWSTRWETSSGEDVQTRYTLKRELRTNGSAGFAFWTGQNTNYSLNVTRDLLYPWDKATLVNVGREIARSQSVSLSQDVNLFRYLRPRVSFDSHYSSARPAPHTKSGQDSLGLPDYSLSTTRRLSLTVGLVHTIRSLARLRDERLDEEAEPGSPRWLLVQLEKYADRIYDPNLTISRSLGSEYRDMQHYPDLEYQFGLRTVLEDEEAYDRSKTDNFQINGGFRPLSMMSVRMEYSNSDSRNYYAGYWNRQKSTTWPSVTLSWSGLERLAAFRDLFRTGTISTGYSVQTTESGRYEQDSYVPTSKTENRNWSPLFSLNATLYNSVQVTISDNLRTTRTRNYTGTNAQTKNSSNNLQFKLQYAFSAPGGLAIPLPLLDRLRVRFRSDLTTSLSISASTSKSEIIGLSQGSEVQSDIEQWRIEPALNYDFGSVVAGLTGIYGWKKDNVNSQYDQKDVGLNVWVTINF